MTVSQFCVAPSERPGAIGKILPICPPFGGGSNAARGGKIERPREGRTPLARSHPMSQFDGFGKLDEFDVTQFVVGSL